MNRLNAKSTTRDRAARKLNNHHLKLVGFD